MAVSSFAHHTHKCVRQVLPISPPWLGLPARGAHCLLARPPARLGLHRTAPTTRHCPVACLRAVGHNAAPGGAKPQPSCPRPIGSCWQRQRRRSLVRPPRQLLDTHPALTLSGLRTTGLSLWLGRCSPCGRTPSLPDPCHGTGLQCLGPHHGLGLLVGSWAQGAKPSMPGRRDRSLRQDFTRGCGALDHRTLGPDAPYLAPAFRAGLPPASWRGGAAPMPCLLQAQHTQR